MNTELKSVNDEVATLREREAAMHEILQVISASRTDTAPVFETILNNATRLSGAPLANLCILNEARSHWTLVAHHGEGLRHLVVGKSTRLSNSHLVPAVSMRTASVVHVENLIETDLYKQGDPGRVAMVEEEGMRTILGVPLLLDDQAIGCITLFRREVKAFSQDEIELVETFAAQAVIAIENVRQFREVQTRLEREKASAEILGVISRSRDDEAPVFDTVLRKARELCDASTAALMLGRPQDQTLVLAALDYSDSHNADDKAERIAHVNAIGMKMDPAVHVSAQAICEARIIHLADLRETESYKAGEPSFKIMVDEQKQRSMLSVPLFDSNGPLGAINVHRQQVGLFSEDEVSLIETFAAQAVIAIENVRQFLEVQTRLERETATREILQVISQSRDDERPVFQSIVDKAARLLNARDVGLMLVNEAGTHIRLEAGMGDNPDTFPIGYEIDLTRPLQSCTAIREARTINIRDIADDDLYRARDPIRVKLVEVDGIRSRLSVPLLKDGVAFGCINLARGEVQPFTEAEIALIDTFAAQAVIAIENVRQFRALETLNAELGERVEAQVGELERMGKLKRFLPAAVADTVVSSGSEKMLSSHRALLGVLFCDIRGFTAFCETAEPEETIEVLQTYHEEMGKLINEHGAGVDHRMGDGIMVLFNDPLPCDDPAGDAVRLAFAMQTRMAELCKSWKRMGHRLGFGVGISLGYATVGLVGYEGRSDYTASGTAVNLAARLCDRAEDGEILLSIRAAIAVEDEFHSVSAGEVALKGIREPVEVFRLDTG